MAWSREQTLYHIQAAGLLDRIMKEAFDYIRANRKNITEYQVQQFILQKFKDYKLKTEKYKPIVAFGKSSDKIHAIPSKKSRKLAKNNVVMIDIWAKLGKKNAPFADITWMGYYGKVPKKVSDVFDIVIKARDKCVSLIKRGIKNKTLLTGIEADSIVKDTIAEHGYKGRMIHSTGHSLGTVSVHGKEHGLNPRNHRRLIKEMGYSIEPGIYLKGKFGVRSEIDFYISKNNKMIITTKVQKRLVRI